MRYCIHIKNYSRKLSLVLSIFCSLLICDNSILGQEKDNQLFKNLMEEDSNYIEAVVLYPDSIRNAIFIASSHPEILVKVDGMTEKSRALFKSLTSSYDQETQSQIWEISRYPKLAEELTINGKLSKKEINYISFGYPENIQKAALHIGTKHYTDLDEINQISYTCQYAFDELIKTYPEEVQSAYRTLLELPEVLEILSDNLRLTILIGDAYNKNPKNVQQKADSMHMEIARKNARELAQWQKSLQEDSIAMQEFSSSAKEYAQEQGYHESDYSLPVNNATIVVHQYSYPYWFGYPHWNSYVYWYPYPWWYDWGFYYGPHGEIIFISLPSYHFMHWYFYNHHHHYNYSHFTNHCVSHYYGHRNSITGMNRAIGHWRNENQSILNESWLSSETGRVERIKEFGKLEMEREKYNISNPNSRISKEQYYNIHSNKYPNLKPHKEIVKVKERPVQNSTNEYYTPKPQQAQQKKPPGKKPLNQNFPYKTPPQKPKKPVVYPTQDHKKARDYHKENWKKPPPTRKPPVRKPVKKVVKDRSPVPVKKK